jgi:hypothetical protein
MNVRIISSSVLAVALVATTAGVYAAPRFDQITVLGFTASVPHIAPGASIAECKINMIRADGRTYCFGKDKALETFTNDVPINIESDQETYAFRGA